MLSRSRGGSSFPARWSSVATTMPFTTTPTLSTSSTLLWMSGSQQYRRFASGTTTSAAAAAVHVSSADAATDPAAAADCASSSVPPTTPPPPKRRLLLVQKHHKQQQTQQSQQQDASADDGAAESNTATTDPSSSSSSSSTSKCRPQLSPARVASLQSMYSLVGGHSAVKLCRWQKSMLRGRGGCYKWTLYGIRSHQCMEATPNMACANKCLFCWRLNTNPTMKEWRWEVDDPIAVADGMLTAHVALVNNVSGMAGVVADRLAEARKPAHCALSLVGEPIMYPRINEFLAELHRRRVSTFLVNNGQFPDAIHALGTTTQLYLSVDSPTREKMKTLDRPVFSDFWERFNASVDAMRARSDDGNGRTVFRLTMIEDFNMFEDDLPHYETLFSKGQPHFIELKSLTPAFQGSTKNFLRIQNVPTWERLVRYAQQMCDVTLGGNFYAIASLHEHSKCVLLAQKARFLLPTLPTPTSATDATSATIDVCSPSSSPLSAAAAALPHLRWHTWIDFERFHDLVAEGRAAASDNRSDASSSNNSNSPQSPSFKKIPVEAYMAPTPDWAAVDTFDDDDDDEHEDDNNKPCEQRDINNHLNTSPSTCGGSSLDAMAKGTEYQGGGGLGFDPQQTRFVSKKRLKYLLEQQLPPRPADDDEDESVR